MEVRAVRGPVEGDLPGLRPAGVEQVRRGDPEALRHRRLPLRLPVALAQRRGVGVVGARAEGDALAVPDLGGTKGIRPW